MTSTICVKERSGDQELCSRTPTDGVLVNEYMEELFAFINRDDEPQYDLLKTAIAHHRFVWVHPFTNGNGRTVRLFTYAMLVKQGFKVNMGDRILNPTAVFCSNRDHYYDMLARADSGTEEGMLEWCRYILSGLKTEIEKVDNLLDHQFLRDAILIPALNYSLERKFVTDEEARALRIAIDKQEVQAADLKPAFGSKDPSLVSRSIRKLLDKQMLAPVAEGKRKYTLRFNNNYILRGVIEALGANSFLPDRRMK